MYVHRTTHPIMLSSSLEKAAAVKSSSLSKAVRESLTMHISISKFTTRSFLTLCGDYDDVM